MNKTYLIVSIIFLILSVSLLTYFFFEIYDLSIQPLTALNTQKAFAILMLSILIGLMTMATLLFIFVIFWERRSRL